MNFLVALETIRNASETDLHSYATQTILTLKTVSQRLQHNLIPSTPGFQTTLTDPPSVASPPHSPQHLQVEPGDQAGVPNSKSLQPLQAARFTDCVPTETPSVPSPPHSPQPLYIAETTALRDQFTLSPQTPRFSSLQVSLPRLTPPTAQSIPARDSSGSAIPVDIIRAPDHVPSLLKRIKQSASWVWEASQKLPCHLLSRKRSSDEDLRLEHIRRLEGDRSLGSDAKLLRVLALRSIGLEFTNEQLDNEVYPTKLEELYQHTLSPTPSNVNIFNYGNNNFFSKSLSAGLKHMVLEKIISERLKKKGMPSICNAISAIAGLHIDQFRRFRYDEMQRFADKLVSDDIYVTISQSKIRLLDLVRDLSPWFNQLQNSYDLIFCNIPVSGMESERQKFRRTDCVRTPDIIDNSVGCLAIPQDLVLSNLGFTNANVSNNGVESPNQEDCAEAEFASIFYEQISNQPIDISGIMDDIARRSCFDFESIAPLDNLGL
ncbi:unnamed protein product [Penicillium egyptiacum]|uniref:Uncharacterized protein n=1 Tax=Penicillium egyptiacum TaxID=1303716 RepID=A0A9W4KFI9_9EURO|nr:unnamed protein product [Penicillium egyptiacum]